MLTKEQLKPLKTFFDERQKERTAQNSGELQVLGTVADVLEFYKPDAISEIRQKEKNPYITLYKQGSAIDNIPFSNALAAVHGKEEMTLTDLFNMPVYGITRDVDDKTVHIAVIGVEQGSQTRDDIVSVTTLFEALKRKWAIA